MPNQTPRVGEPAPPFALVTADGRRFALADALDGVAGALLVFTRHYG